MSLLSTSGDIFLIKEPVCGRYGMHKLRACLTAGTLGVKWNCIDEITVVTFNKAKTICSILHIDSCGWERTTRRLKRGRYDVILSQGLIPGLLTRQMLERLLSDGTQSGPLRSEEGQTYLARLRSSK